MSTTPLELVTVGRVPAREGGLLTSAAPSVVEVFPGVFLIASIIRAKNQCVMELVQPTTSLVQGDSAASTPLTSPSLPIPPETQRRLSELDSVSHRGPGVASVAVPVALKSAFRVPRIIQLVAEDEGVIETVTLVREPLGVAFLAALGEQDRSASQNPLRDTTASNFNAATTSAGAAASSPSVSHPSIHSVHVHFFIGTSNGTVLVGNALRGTILAVAQFQYHHRFTNESRGNRTTTTATTVVGEEAGDAPVVSKAPAKNQAVVKFVVRERRPEQLWNPALPFTQESAVLASHDTTAQTGKKPPTASPTDGSCLVSIYVIHSGGKVVELTRAALDTFVQSSVDRLDGRRPHLILEWDPEVSPSSFPVAGPASDFAAHVAGVFVLESPPSFSTIEKRAATAKAASPESTHFSIRDADVLTELPELAASSALLAPLEAQRRPCETLLVGGSSPLFSFYRLQPLTSGFSASNAIKAVKNMVTGVARTLWFSALGTTNPVERPPHLRKIATSGSRACLGADAKCSALQIDPSQQWAAFAIEGGGRIYVADVHTGVISGVLKGCRAAQFTWWWVECAAGRPALLLVVYLPLRRAVEVYTARTWDRLAACHVPEGCVLLRPCRVPSERPSRSMLDSRNVSGSRQGSAACTKGGCGALLMDPAGTVYEVRIRWTLTDPMDSTRRQQLHASPLSQDASFTVPGDETELLSGSVLRGCQTPDDFLEVALQLPLPQPRVVWEEEEEEEEEGAAVAPASPDAEDTSGAEDSGPATKAYMVVGGETVRRYGKSLEHLCSTVQRRFAPGWAEIAVTPMPCTPLEALEGSLDAVPRSTTAAQCLHYVRAYRSLTENYYRLLCCRRVSPSRFFDPAQWTSGLITPELWRVNFSTSASAATANFVRQTEERMCALLATYAAEQGIYKKHFASHLRQVLRKVAPTTTSAVARALADPGSFMPLSTFLRCFYCGTARPSFLRGAIEIAEDADGCVNFLGPLADLIFGVLGLDGFFAQLPALTDLGCTDSDVALLTVTWVSRQGGRDLDALLATSTVGLLAATLLTFSDDDFLHALDRAAIPFISVDGDLATSAAAGSITGLLWCCAIRCTLRSCATLTSGQRFARRVRQLLQLWITLTKGTSLPAAQTGGSGSDASIAFSLRLCSVEPPSLPLTAASSSELLSPSGVEGTNGACTEALTEGDTFEVYLQRNGITISLLDDFAVPRGEADADAVRNFPLFSSFVSSLGATEHVRSRSSCGACDSPDVVESLPWIEGHQWDEARFRNEVTKPLERLWQQLATSASSPTGKGIGGGGGLRGAFRGVAAADKGGRATVYKSCLLLVAMSVLEHAIRPLTDLSFFFWDNNAVPDANFFPVDGAPAGLVLSGSRTSREYLKSMQKQASLVEGMVQQAVEPLENAERVLLIQHISMALSEDDALLFPLIPNFLRARLNIWMQVLAQAPHAPLRRVQRVGRLVALLLFFSEASTLTMGGVALTQLQSQLCVPWRELIGGANRRDQLRLLPDIFIAGGQPAASPRLFFAHTHNAAPTLSAYAREDESPHPAPLQLSAAAAVLRRFLVAGGVLYAQQHDQLLSSSNAAPCLGLVSEDTRQCLSRLAHCLGLYEALPDIADVVLMDYEVKHLFPLASVEQEMLLLSTKTAAPHVGLSVMQCYLVQVLQYVTTQRKGYEQRGDRAALDATSEQLRKLVAVLSNESRAWLQQRETQMLSAATTESDVVNQTISSPTSNASATPPSDASVLAAVPASLLLCDATWVSVTEYQSMRTRVFATLALPQGTPERRNFFRLLFVLSQWACEGRLTLPLPLQRIARELPMVVENWERTV